MGAGRFRNCIDPGEGAAPTTAEPTLPLVHAMRQQARFFLDAIRGKTTPLCGADEARRDLVAAKRYLELFTASRPAKAAAAR